MIKLSIQEAETPAWPSGVTAPSTSPFEIWTDHAGGVYAYGEVFGEECWMHVPGLASFRFTPHGNEVAATVAAGVSTAQVVDAYRRRILPMALHVSGREILHASSITSSAGVTAFCGPAFVGKSTIAFGLRRRGYTLWGDDALAVEVSHGGAHSLSLPFEIRLRRSAAEFFGLDTTPASAPGDDELPGILTAPLASICVLQRTDSGAAPVSDRRLPSAEAFAAILAHACWFTLRVSEGKRRLIDNYLDLAARTPIFQITFKPGLDNLPAVLDVIEQLLQSHQASGEGTERANGSE